MHFHRDVLAIADTFGAHTSCRPAADDVFTGTPPLAFTFGLGGLLRLPAARRRLRPADREGDAGRAAPSASTRHGVTVCFTAPTGVPGDAARRLRAAAAARCAGRSRPASTCPQAVWEAFRDATGVELIDGIGATEMLHIFISAADDDIRPGATGRAVPGYAPTVARRRRRRRRRRRARAGWRSRARPAAATSPTRARRRTCRTAGTSPATPTSATTTATSGTRPAATT